MHLLFTFTLIQKLLGSQYITVQVYINQLSLLLLILAGQYLLSFSALRIGFQAKRVLTGVSSRGNKRT
jgi:hypothetical protein